ncbi:MAG: SDR family oxidoreductase [Candidatus Rokuibacteriota bacterium]
MIGSESRRVLVTGATGFIGREVVRRLLARGELVTALARGRDGRSAAARVGAALGTTTGVANLEVVEGDLAESEGGLSRAVRSQLRGRVTTVINCAGETAFFPEYPARFRAGHVDGPVSLLECLARGRLSTWAHVSTAYVCGRRTGVALETEGDVGQEFHNPYERVKLDAETAVGAAGVRQNVDVRIFRPSAVVGRGPDTLGGAPSTVLVRFIRLAAVLARQAAGARVPLRIEAAPRVCFNVVPLGYVVRSIIRLTRCRRSAHQTFHLVVSDAPRQESMLDMLTERLGVRGVTLVDGRAAVLPNLSALERRVRLLLGRYRDYLSHEVRFDDTNTRRALARHGVAPATLGPADVQRLIDHALWGQRARSLRASSLSC